MAITCIAFVFVALNIVLSVLCARRLASRRAEKNARAVHLSGFMGVVGMACGAVFSLALIAMSFGESADLGTALLFCGFVALCVTLMVAYLNLEIRYDDSGFTAKNFLGISRRYRYDEITGIRENADATVFIRKKRVTIEQWSVGDVEFLRLARAHTGNLPACRSESRFDLFRGHVKNPGEIVFAYGLIFVVLLAALIAVCVSSRPVAREDTVAREAVFSICQIDESALYLLDEENGARYQIARYQFYGDQLKPLIDARAPSARFTAFVKRVTPSDKPAYWRIYELLDESGAAILTLEQANANARENTAQVYRFLIAFLLIWLAYVLISVRVGRNPRKYSKRVFRLFFKA